MRRILIYGNSNVWGDNFFTSRRLPYEKLKEEKLFQNSNDFYHYLIDYSMKKIASDISKKYDDTYIPYSDKEKAYLCDERYIPISELQKKENIKLYKKDLEKRIAML